MPRGWFSYVGLPADKTLAASYVFVGLNPATDFECSGNGAICTIYAIYGGTPVVGTSHPTPPLTAGVLSYINISNVFSTNLPFNERTYLYVKS